MNYHNITHDDMLNGDGLRVVLWVSGCTHRCDGCHNPITWELSSGIEFDNKAKKELFDALEKPYIDGITFSGGDPMHPMNRGETLALAKEIKEKFPNKTAWLYTGFLWENICDIEEIKYLDVLADGRFEKDKFDPKIKWVGSSNQRIIDVQKTLKQNEISLYL